MSELKLFLLGPPRIELDGVPTDLKRRKALALLAYLAVSGEAQRRDTLATLLMPDSTQSSARAALRRDLASLNQSLGKSWIEAGRETIGLNPAQKIWIDVDQFRQHLHDCEQKKATCLEQLTKAVQLYRDDFLVGFTLPNCPEFDDWQFYQTEDFRQSLARALEKLVYWLSANKAYEPAITYARRWLSLDQLHEPAHQQLMILYALSGQMSGAMRQHQVLIDTLEEEMGVPPSPESADLYKRIRAGEFHQPQDWQISPTDSDSGQPETSVEPESDEPLYHNLPPQSTPFVGRETDLANAIASLQDPACQLLTIIGPGGIGKTRLAIQTAQSFLDHQSEDFLFPHGIVYIPLTHVTTQDGIISAIADAVQFTFYNDVPPKQQLLDYLREKQQLLILDNIEHLIDEAELFSDILANAADVKILVTSRELLNLHEEWHQILQGLSYPETETVPADLEAYNAIKLFVQSAKRAQPAFSLTDEAASVLRICQLVEGMPLAIELAAAWLKMFPCDRIATEIESNIDFLATNLRNVPERHRSMWAVFEYSWQLLSDLERGVLMHLSVFRGGFRQEAAKAIIGASLMTLATLVEKSILYTTSAGRYHIHELLRQYVAEKLHEEPEIEAKTRDRHSKYYLTYLNQQGADLNGPQQEQVLSTMQAEIRNVQVAWLHAIQQKNLAIVDQTSENLYQFYETWSRFQRGEALYATALEALQASGLEKKSTPILGKLMTRQGAFAVSLGQHTSASQSLQTGLTIARDTNDPIEIAFALHYLGVLASIRGDHLQAKTYLQEVLDISHPQHHQQAIANALLRLGEVSEDLGDYKETEKIWQESLAVNRGLGNQDGIAYSLAKLAVMHFSLGRYKQAKQHYQESLEIFQEMNDAYGQAITLGGLALAAYGRGDLKELSSAKPLAEESVRICREIGHRSELTMRLLVLGLVSQGLDSHREALDYYLEALDIAQHLNFPRGLAWSYILLGDANRAIGEIQFAEIYLRKGLELALAGQFNPAALVGLFHYAEWLMGDVVADKPTTPVDEQTQTRIINLLQLVANHPTGWHKYKMKAATYIEHLDATFDTETIPSVNTQDPASLESIIETILS
ncbi:MAG: tetratricopeptide repeat protein [Chloroflexota bacterium]